jgi:6-phosphofructokinase 1
MTINKIGVLTSGGDAPGMNAAVRAVVRTAIYLDLNVVGIRRGYEGLLDNDFIPLNLGSVGDIIHRGGTILRTARSSRYVTPEGIKLAAENCLREGIEGIVVIGGDGSFRGALALAQAGIKAVGVPGTIDNDIAMTDMTIGFDTSVNTVIDSINRIRDTASSHGRVFIIETMGRNSGEIALYAGVAGGAETVIIPELPMDIEEIAERIKRGISRGKLHSIILVSEGCSSAYDVGDSIEQLLNIETKKIVLGHIQRGGSPTAFDRVLASRMGTRAVEYLYGGVSGVMTALQGKEIIPVKFEDSFGKTKEVNMELYNLTKILSI